GRGSGPTQRHDEVRPAVLGILRHNADAPDAERRRPRTLHPGYRLRGRRGDGAQPPADRGRSAHAGVHPGVALDPARRRRDRRVRGSVRPRPAAHIWARLDKSRFPSPLLGGGYSTSSALQEVSRSPDMRTRLRVITLSAALAAATFAASPG